jgi:hypothetical protein
MSMNNYNDTIGNRTRDLLACSAVPNHLRHQQRALIFITNTYYNYIINALYNYISNKGLVEECDKEENLEVTGALLLRV